MGCKCRWGTPLQEFPPLQACTRKPSEEELSRILHRVHVCKQGTLTCRHAPQTQTYLTYLDTSLEGYICTSGERGRHSQRLRELILSGNSWGVQDWAAQAQGTSTPGRLVSSKNFTLPKLFHHKQIKWLNSLPSSGVTIN